jgi:hypothetical protein
MAMSQNEAAQSLREVAEAQKRSAEAYGYNQSAPYFFIWGLAWAIGYGGEALFRPYLGWIWTGVVLAGVAASILISMMQNNRHGRSGWRTGVLFVVFYAFTFSLFAVMHPTDNFQVGAYFPLLFAALYTGIGLWLGMRYVIVGAVLAAATLGAYFFLHDYFFLRMAIVGGGSLILTGFWLKRA